MNIVITLPREMINAIISGHKCIEVRHTIPQRFDKDEDVVLVVEKGTKNIPILFSIMEFKIYRISDTAYRDFSVDAAVSPEWIANYCLKAERVCTWVIGRVCLLKYPDNAASKIGLKNNPQAYVYNDYKVNRIVLGESFWTHRVKDQEKSIIYAPDKRNKIILEYLASGCEVDFLQWCENNNIPFNWRGRQLK